MDHVTRGAMRAIHLTSFKLEQKEEKLIFGTGTGSGLS